MLSGTTHFQALPIESSTDDPKHSCMSLRSAKSMKSLKMWFLQDLYVDIIGDTLHFELFEENDCASKYYCFYELADFFFNVVPE